MFVFFSNIYTLLYEIISKYFFFKKFKKNKKQGNSFQNKTKLNFYKF